jgi:hypothetical protein
MCLLVKREENLWNYLQIVFLIGVKMEAKDYNNAPEEQVLRSRRG